MSFLGLLVHNLVTRKVRTALTAFAVAIGVATVMTLGVVTHSLRSTAGSVIRTGKADFTVAQKGVTDILNSVIDERQARAIAASPHVGALIGTFIATTDLDADHPVFIEIGIDPSELQPFGVRVLTGRPFTATARNEAMLGYRAAEDLGKTVGDTITLEGHRYTITGIYRVDQPAGDAAVMLPLTTLQGVEHQDGEFTLLFVQTKPGTTRGQTAELRHRIEVQHPSLATVRSQSEFGRVDRSLELLSAADRGATILTLVIGAIIVANTMLLSFFERTREFGVMRAIGWTRRRVMALVVGEGLALSVLGAALGLGIAVLATQALSTYSSIKGFLHPEYTSDIFGRALYTAAGIGFVGALYPGARAALLRPMEALRRE